MSVCHIVSAGDFAPDFFTPEAGDLVIACDAGLSALEEIGAAPDLTVGDFDSYGRTPTKGNIVVLPERKDDTDTLYALRIGLEKGYGDYLLHGALGGARISHSMANLSCLAFLADRGARGVLIGKDVYAALLEDERLILPADSAGILSLFPCGGDCAVSLDGVSYPYKGVLSPSLPLGVSNGFCGKEATIEATSGRLFVICEGANFRPHALLSCRKPLED